jgi:GABA permease
MRKYLVVANQTLGGAELRKELRRRVAAEQCSFYVLVPNTRAAHYQVVPAAGGFVPMPSMATSYGPETDEEATAEAKARLSQMLAELTEWGAPAEGHLGGANPLEGVEAAIAERTFDEVIVATLPRRVSRWLGADVPQRIERQFGLPVTTIAGRG